MCKITQKIKQWFKNKKDDKGKNLESQKGGTNMALSDNALYLILECFNRPSDIILERAILRKLRLNGIAGRVAIRRAIREGILVRMVLSNRRRCALSRTGGELWMDIFKR